MILDHLAKAERHVAEGLAHIGRQRALAEKLQLEGNLEATESARNLLAQFEEMQTLHVADRDRLIKELSEHPN